MRKKKIRQKLDGVELQCIDALEVSLKMVKVYVGMAMDEVKGCSILFDDSRREYNLLAHVQSVFADLEQDIKENYIARKVKRNGRKN